MTENETVEEIVQETVSADPSQTAETIEMTAVPDHPFLTTDFSDYSVSEGLLLLLLLFAVISFCVKLLKGGFYWLW